MTELERFAHFCRLAGLDLEPFQRKIMREVFGTRREVVVTQPRGAGKTTLEAAHALYVLARNPEWQIVVAAASRDQAQHLFRQASRFAKQLPELRAELTFTQREIRTRPGGRLAVISADAEKQLGWDPNLVIIDELGSHRDDSLYISLRTSLIKRPDARLVVISTVGSPDGPFAELRRRALERGRVTRKGAFTRASSPNLILLEWSVPTDASIDDMGSVKAANVASWITEEALAEQREAIRESAFRRLHCNQEVAGDEAFIDAAEWDRNSAAPELAGDGFRVIGVDAAVSSDTAAIALVRRDPEDVYHVIWRVWVPTKRDKVPLADVEAVTREWAQTHQVDAVVYDARFFEHAAQNLEDAGVPVKAWRYQRNAAAAGTLHEIVSHGRLRHGGADLPRRHALAAEIRDREFGQVISKTKSREHIDCLMALAYAVDEAAALKEKRESVYETRGLVTAG